MKLLIDIDETKLTTIKHCYVTFGKDLFDLENYIIECIKNGKPYKEKPQGKWENGYVFALDKAFFKFDANCTYSGDRVLQILEKLKEEKGGADIGGEENEIR